MHLKQSDFLSLLLDIRAFHAKGFVLPYFLTLTVPNLVLNGGLKWLPTQTVMETHARKGDVCMECKYRRPGVYYRSVVEVSPIMPPIRNKDHYSHLPWCSPSPKHPLFLTLRSNLERGKACVRERERWCVNLFAAAAAAAALAAAVAAAAVAAMAFSTVHYRRDEHRDLRSLWYIGVSIRAERNKKREERERERERERESSPFWQAWTRVLLPCLFLRAEESWKWFEWQCIRCTLTRGPALHSL